MTDEPRPFTAASTEPRANPPIVPPGALSGGTSALRRGRPVRALAALAAAGLILAGLIGPVAAVSPEPTRALAERHRYCSAEWEAAIANPTVETLRAVGDCEIRRRIATLDALDARVAGSEVITLRHQEQLRKRNDVNPASYEVERAGLLELQRRIASETDLRALRALIVDIAEEFRVYVLVVPKTYLVGGADATDKATTRLSELATRLEALIERAAAAGKDVTEARRLLEDMEGKIGRADRLVEPVVGGIMPLSPADWNAGEAGPALREARSTIQEARDLLRAARADAGAIISLLRA